MTEPGDQVKAVARPPGLGRMIWVLEHAQDYVAGLIAVSRFERKQE
jgi:hypothetical protein